MQYPESDVRTRLRPILTALLLVLVTTWGICPCTMAKALGLAGSTAAEGVCGADEGLAADTRAPACCCKPMPPASSGDESDAPADDECPCCKRGGWMRDLPPQAQAIDLDLPAPTFLDLPMLAATVAVELPAPEVARSESGPPTCQRPHAAPVGIVRILS